MTGRQIHQSQTLRAFIWKRHSYRPLPIDSIGIGRPNLIREEARETVRESTIVYSDISNPEANKLKYSFNYTDPNTKNLPEKYNSIQYLGDEGQYIYCIQEDRLSRVPVDRNILSDVSGTESLQPPSRYWQCCVFCWSVRVRQRPLVCN